MSVYGSIVTYHNFASLHTLLLYCPDTLLPCILRFHDYYWYHLRHDSDPCWVLHDLMRIYGSDLDNGFKKDRATQIILNTRVNK